MPAITPASRSDAPKTPCPHCGKPYRTLVKRNYGLEIDGGITPQIAPEAVRAGANAFVAGSAVFKDRTPDSYRANIAAIRNAAALARGEAA